MMEINSNVNALEYGNTIRWGNTLKYENA